jgi:hypothetical protein
MSPLTSSASVSMKLNLGKFETVDCFLAVSGIEATTTREEIDRLLDGPTREAFEAMRDRLRARAIEIKSKRRAAEATS